MEEALNEKQTGVGKRETVERDDDAQPKGTNSRLMEYEGEGMRRDGEQSAHNEKTD